MRAAIPPDAAIPAWKGILYILIMLGFASYMIPALIFVAFGWLMGWAK